MVVGQNPSVAGKAVVQGVVPEQRVIGINDEPRGNGLQRNGPVVHHVTGHTRPAVAAEGLPVEEAFTFREGRRRGGGGSDGVGGAVVPPSEQAANPAVSRMSAGGAIKEPAGVEPVTV
jgi:hypothetical protein